MLQTIKCLRYNANKSNDKVLKTDSKASALHSKNRNSHQAPKGEKFELSVTLTNCSKSLTATLVIPAEPQSMNASHIVNINKSLEPDNFNPKFIA